MSHFFNGLLDVDMKRVAIIGAGLSGLTLGHLLQDVAQITLFDKGRSPGGRLAYRRAHPYVFDHGVQFFRAKTEAFQKFLDPWVRSGVIQPWCSRFVEINQGILDHGHDWSELLPHYVGVPHMNAFPRALAKGLDIRLGTRIIEVQSMSSQWALYDDSGAECGLYDWIVYAMPVAQVIDLMNHSSRLFKQLEGRQMKPCDALMLGFEAPLVLPFDAALIKGAPISWISMNQTKPERSSACSMVVHSTNQWALEHAKFSNSEVIKILKQAASEVVGSIWEQPVYEDLQRWRYANIAPQKGQQALLDLEERVAICGDWLIQGRVEAAFQSASYLADQLIQQWA